MRRVMYEERLGSKGGAKDLLANIAYCIGPALLRMGKEAGPFVEAC